MYCHTHHCHIHHCRCGSNYPTGQDNITKEELLAFTQEMKGELKDYTVDLKDQIFSYIDVGLNPVEIANSINSLKEQDTFVLKTLTKKIDDLNNTSNLSMFNLRTRVTDLEGQSATIINNLIKLENDLGSIPFEDGLLADTFVTVTNNAEGSAARTQHDKNSEYVSVLDFGAVGDGQTDSSVAIQNANDYCASNGKTLFFPSGEYRGAGLQITTDWVGEKGSIIKSLNPVDQYSFCRVNNQAGLSIEKLTLDGNVSADPAVWDATTHKGFDGAGSLFVYGSSNIRLVDVKFRNSKNAGLRIEDCSQIYAVNCDVKRSRHIFGDGYYVAESDNVYLINCYAHDVTRIGFVMEASCVNCFIINCKASYGHNGSRMYGGTEFNVGFWYENSASIITDNCTAEDFADGGFKGTTGANVSNYEQSHLYYSSCESINCGLFGFQMESLATFGASNIVLSGCKSFGSGRSFDIIAKSNNCTFRILNCHAETDQSKSPTQSLSYGYAAEAGVLGASIIIDNCTLNVVNPVPSAVDALNSNVADISGFNPYAIDLKVNNVRNIDATKPVTFKAPNGAATISLRNCLLRIITCESKSLHIDKCTLRDFSSPSNSLFKMSNSVLNAANPLVLVARGRVELSNVDVISGGNGPLHINMHDTARPIIKNCNFYVNLDNEDYSFRLRNLGTTIIPAIFIGNTFHNAGADTTTKSFLYIDKAMMSLIASSNIYDSSVTYDTNDRGTLKNTEGFIAADIS